MTQTKRKIRETQQFELPLEKREGVTGYDVYPAHNIGEGKIEKGYAALAKEIAQYNRVKIDGYVGILFEDVKEGLQEVFTQMGVSPTWVNIGTALKPEHEIDAMVAPFLGGDDPVFGRITTLELADFFNAQALHELALFPKEEELVIFYGIGAQLLPIEAKTIYFDISKNEIQFRSRARSIANLGASSATNAKAMYKRFYFVDWVVLNKHKNAIKGDIDYLVDGQRSHKITWTTAAVWRESLAMLSQNPIRVRPWFEPGIWGGQWIKDTIEGLQEDVVNYAWSFELIVPENGIIIESSGLMLEFSFDFLMYAAAEAVLGTDFKTYKYEFPIRFDFLDTFDGGNLSIQCHPQKEYIQQHFGETITQEETYYILDKKGKALVYLGFQEGVTPTAFQQALEDSQREEQQIDITQYVQAFEAEKHELYLIPPGTIHGSGENNLVLEISATPYIYTFKMYDWMRMDLDGKPRPINIERGMDNLNFGHSGERVKNELISIPKVLEHNAYWELQHLPTHPEHLYDVHRWLVNTEVIVQTNGKALVLSLVEGESVEIVANGKIVVFHYAETFVIPAATVEFTIRNNSPKPIMVIKAFVK